MATSETRTDSADICTALRQSDVPLFARIPHPDELPPTSGRGAMDIKPKALYEAIHRPLGFLNYNAKQGRQVSVCDKPCTRHLTIAPYCCVMLEVNNMSIVNHDGILNPCTRCLLYKYDVSALAYGTTRYETGMCNAYNELRALLNWAFVLQRRGQKPVARENRRQSETE